MCRHLCKLLDVCISAFYFLHNCSFFTACTVSLTVSLRRQVFPETMHRLLYFIITIVNYWIIKNYWILQNYGMTGPLVPMQHVAMMVSMSYSSELCGEKKCPPCRLKFLYLWQRSGKWVVLFPDIGVFDHFNQLSNCSKCSEIEGCNTEFHKFYGLT